MAKLAVLSLMASGAVAQYSLSATYTGDSFFDIFDFFIVSSHAQVSMICTDDYRALRVLFRRLF